jgi:hypothetical protein
MRRSQAIVWNRALVRTNSERLGIARESVQPGYLICILYGCTVPVILKRVTKPVVKRIEDKNKKPELKKGDTEYERKLKRTLRWQNSHLFMESEEDEAAAEEEAVITVQRALAC